ncbi:MAG TPA: hypothetical protein VFS05_14270 [Gemmatimonadaceae bacterium]|nr:hypothetical protein [Gemmatimonadaceae bacterium]
MTSMRMQSAHGDAELLPPRLALAFAPIHKRALGVAIGTASGLLLFVITAVAMLRPPSEVSFLSLLAEYFYGYTVSWPGAAVALIWGFAVGFVAGWFIAFCRNLALALSIFISRTRGELEQTADFLDHI